MCSKFCFNLIDRICGESLIRYGYFTGQAETQVWLEFSLKCGYLKADIVKELYSTYDDILGKLVNMINHPENWIIGRTK